ncbi:TrmH family RNA methyltransferase [Alkalicoccus saliphilus]|uniref:RNA methyltransferase n=1 Tax=Alkalicoccus saliphilus TaxID=200989 RepID=A0A2T4U931_9BACI|nr:RNA methyltransferase [Alkalicoccus saliphilus]PTL39890.1 RNA methyltransferase [Alkalicoccus saliphilus]
MEPIASAQNPRIKAWKKLQRKRERDRSGLFLVEGEHLVEEALKSNINVKEIIVVEDRELPKEWAVTEVEVVRVTERVFQELAETETPQGMIAVCEKPPPENMLFESGRYLFLDRIQDPGNLGNLVRTAEAAGLQGVVFGSGCADPYNGKVVRSTQGALFYMPVQQMDLSEALEHCRANRVPVFGTSLNGSTYSAIAPQESFALLMGNEGSGVDPSLLEQTDHNLYIPVHGRSDSLNVSVAAGILIYHLRGD